MGTGWDRLPSRYRLAGYVDSMLAQAPDDRARSSIIPTGLRDLDETLAGGLRPGQLTLVTGVTGVGSSMFALGLLRSAVFRNGSRAALIAPDSNLEELHARIVGAEASIGLSRLRSDALFEDERVRLSGARDRLASAPLTIVAGSTAALTSGRALDLVRDMTDHDESITVEPVPLVVVDGTNRMEAELREFVKGLRVVAQERRLSVVVVSPTRSRTVRDLPVSLDDLGDHATVTDLFDVILVIARPDLHDASTDRAGEADLAVVKNRFGPVRRLAPVAFQGHWARFAEMVWT